MSQFFKRFLSEEAARLNPGSDRFVALGAFGKHPGWDDHIEDLGLETESLTLAKRVLYIQGVGGQIDTGAWEKLEPAGRLEFFNHLFVWQRSGQFLLGRLWSSSDGKGRTRYPMVLCAHCIGASLAWGLEYVMPRLQELEQACKAASSAAEVRSLLDGTRSRLRAVLPSAESETRFTPSTAEGLRSLIADPVFGPEHQGWFRILYQLENQMAAFKAGSFNSKTDMAALRPQQIRLPVGANSPEQALLLWRRFFAAQINRFVPLLMVVSPGETWLDGILGEPSTQEFFCLRARPEVLPLATEVPYDLNEQFKAKAGELLANLQTGGRPAASAPAAAPAAASTGWASVTQRWFKGKGAKLWLAMAIGVAIVAGGAAVWFTTSRSGSRPADQLTSIRPTTVAPAGGGAVPESKPRGETARIPEGGAQPPAQTPSLAATQAQAEAEAKRLAEESRRQDLEKQRAAEAEAAQRLAQARTQEVAAPVSNAMAKPPIEPAQNREPQPLTQGVSSTLVQTGTVVAPAVSVTAAPEKTRPMLPGIITNGIGMTLMWVAALPACGEGAYVSKYEVTQRQFEQVMATNPSQSKNALQPVESVTWEEAVDFCRKLTALEKGRNASPPGLAYALPSEAQWEFFLADARFEDAVTSRNPGAQRDTPSPVGSLAPNKFGLYDVLGNVWEFCSDVSDSGARILHGGAFNSRKLFGEKASEWKPLDRTTPRRLGPQDRAADAGFRCVATVQP